MRGWPRACRCRRQPTRDGGAKSTACRSCHKPAAPTGPGRRQAAPPDVIPAVGRTDPSAASPQSHTQNHPPTDTKRARPIWFLAALHPPFASELQIASTRHAVAPPSRATLSAGRRRRAFYFFPPPRFPGSSLSLPGNTTLPASTPPLHRCLPVSCSPGCVRSARQGKHKTRGTAHLARCHLPPPPHISLPIRPESLVPPPHALLGPCQAPRRRRPRVLATWSRRRRCSALSRHTCGCRPWHPRYVFVPAFPPPEQPSRPTSALRRGRPAMLSSVPAHHPRARSAGARRFSQVAPPARACCDHDGSEPAR